MGLRTWLGVKQKPKRRRKPRPPAGVVTPVIPKIVETGIELDVGFYRAAHADLARFNDQELRNHYNMHGHREGRACASIARRAQFIAMVREAGSVLEIGPSYRPALRGPHISYFDIAGTDGLRERAAKRGKPADDIPEIEFVHPYGDLGVVNRTFDAVFSAHCIEHQPDLIRHLYAVDALLHPGGSYFLLVPDKRYCFDHFIADSTVAQIVGAHHEGRSQHAVTSLIEHYSLTTHNDSGRHWRGDHADADYQAEIPGRIGRARQAFVRAKGAYVDVHAWQFTPQSFRRTIDCLHAAKLSPFVARVFGTVRNSNEFAAILSRPS